MSILVQCKNGHTLRVKDDVAGKKVRCPQCQTVVLVDEAASEDAESSSSRPRRPSGSGATKKARGTARAKKKSGNGTLIWAIAGGAGIGLIVLGVALFLFLRPSPAPTVAAVPEPSPPVAPSAPAPKTPDVPPAQSPAPEAIAAAVPEAKKETPAAEITEIAPLETPMPDGGAPVAETESATDAPAVGVGVTVWETGEATTADIKGFTAKGENWTAVAPNDSLPRAVAGDCVIENGKIWLHIPRDSAAPIRLAAKGDQGPERTLPMKIISDGDASGPRVSQVAEFSNETVRVTIGDPSNPVAICRITAGKHWVEFIPQASTRELTLDVQAKFVVMPTEFGEDEICDADWALQRSETSTISLPHENMVLILEKEGNHLSLLTYPSIKQAGELTLGLDDGGQARDVGALLGNPGGGNKLAAAGNDQRSASAIVKSVSAKFEGNSVFACLLPQQGLWQSEVVAKKYSAPGHYPIADKSLAPGIWRIGGRISGKKGPQFYVSEYPNTNLLFECRQSGTIQCLFYYLFRPLDEDAGGTLTPLEIYRETLGESGASAYLLETEKAGRLFHPDTKYRGVCGCVDDMKDVWRKQPPKLAADPGYFTSQLGDCKTIIDHMDVRLREYAAMAQHLAEVLEQIESLDLPKDDTATQTYLSVIRNSQATLKASVVVDANRAYTLLEEVEAKIHSAANKKISLSELDKQIEKVRDVANKQEDQLKKFRGIYLTLSKASLTYREKAEEPLKSCVLAIGHDCRRMLRTRGRAE